MLCATIKTDSLDLIEAANQKADLIELRLDLFNPLDLKKLRRACQKPVIFKLTEFNSAALSLLPDFADLPYGINQKIDPRVRRICSFHDEHKTPDLPSLYQKMEKCSADYYKIATFARSSSDALRMLQFVREKQCIGLCMGEAGTVTRILAPVFRAPWTYALLNEKQKTAPGQLLLDELVHTYRYRFLSPDTTLYGLIGNPVNKSMSHRIHNFAFSQLGLDAVYVKMPVKQKEVSSFLSLCREVGFCGLSVTMPLKELIVKGEAINTIGLCDNKINYWNTDGSGALNALEKKVKVAGKRLVILGAGGAATAIAQEAKRRRAEVVIANRTFERACKLATQIGGTALPLNQFASKGYAILINCTPNCPIEKEKLLEDRVVMDIVSRPRMTPFLKAAKVKGCQLVYGMDMFIQQAIGQYCHWFIDAKSLENKTF